MKKIVEFKHNAKVDSNYLDDARDPITGRLCFGMIGNLVPNFFQKDVRQDDSRKYKFFDKKTRKIINQ